MKLPGLPVLLVATAVASGTISGSAAWYVQGLRGENEVLNITNQQKDSQIKSIDNLLTMNTRLQKEKDDAVTRADQRVQTAQRTAANATRAVERMQFNLANSTAVADATESSLRAYTTTLTGLFSRCLREYRAMGERAQGHALDLEEHRDAWPKTLSTPATSESPK